MAWHDIEQNTQEWELLRLGKITASQFAAVMTESPGVFGETAQKYALSLALERITGKKSVNQVKTFHMKRGHEQESIARELYESQYFYEVDNGGFYDCGFYGDSPDGRITDSGLLEIKSVTATVQYNTLIRNNYDPVYHWQIVGHLHCSGREWCDYVSYCADFPAGKQLLVYRVNRNDVLKDMKILAERLVSFNAIVNEKVNQINSLEI
ncbi:MAG: hypothetical protein [Bacteriophage sp.]|nr:MAG: hypothetical protein [Bacteriophage sp.]